jgi:hypothetical protein
LPPTYAKNLEYISLYAKSELAFETNIFEQQNDDKPVLCDLFWLGFAHKYYSRYQYLNINLNSSLSCYNHYQTENKTLHVLSLSHSFIGQHHIVIQSDLQVFNKQWYNNNHGYSNNLISTSIGLSYPKIQTLLGVQYQFNNFTTLAEFTSDQSTVFLHFRHSPLAEKITSLRIAWNYIRYAERTVYQSSPSDSLNHLLQKDECLFLQLGHEFHGKAIGGIFLRYLIVHSNSQFSSFQTASIRLFNTQKIGQTYIQLILEGQIKQYSEKNAQFFRFTNPDPEQNIQDQILLGLERPIGRHIALQGKVAFIKNETIYSNQYYLKWFVATGLTYRL